MDPSFLFFLSLGAVILVLFVFILFFLLPRLLKNLSGRGGGWSRLAEKFPGPFQPEGAASHRQTIQVGAVAYKNCATMAFTPQGLYLEVKIPFFSRLTPLLIPWESILDLRGGTLYWRKTVTLSIGSPEIGTITVFQDLYEKMRPFIPPDKQRNS
jgi:hypothetical protein